MTVGAPRSTTETADAQNLFGSWTRPDITAPSAVQTSASAAVAAYSGA